MKERYNSIDLFKFIMAIVVIAIHTNPFDQCRSVFVNEAVMTIEDMAVPFFFMASGFLLATGWGETCQLREKYIQKTVISTFRLYMTWTLFSLPLTIYGYMVSGNSMISCILSYVKYFFFVGKLYNSYHLWYLLAMLYALGTMWILMHRSKSTQHILITGIFFYIIYLLFAWILQNGNGSRLLTAAGKGFYFVFNNGGVFTGMLYMSIGICIREHRSLSTLASVLGIAAGILVRYTLSHELGSILSSVMLFALVLNMHLENSKCYIVLRNMSKYIYLSHLLCFSFYTFIIIKRPNKLGIDSFLVTFTLAFAISAVIIFCKRIFREK